jgi:hypothetical protein
MLAGKNTAIQFVSKHLAGRRSGDNSHAVRTPGEEGGQRVLRRCLQWGEVMDSTLSMA